MNIYLATSWRNERYEKVKQQLEVAGHSVYNFKHPDNAFHWSTIDSRWLYWDNDKINKALEHPLAKKAFSSDYEALQKCDILVLLLPCGKSAHLEAGYALGEYKPVYIINDKHPSPELMYDMATKVFAFNEVRKLILELKDYNC